MIDLVVGGELPLGNEYPSVVGDFNGDRRADIALPTPTGAVLVFGARSFPRVVHVGRWPRTLRIRLRAHPVLPRCCRAVPDEILWPITPLGDLNGDGLADIGIGGEGYDVDLAKPFGSRTTPSASAFVVFGEREAGSLDLLRARHRVAVVATGLRSDDSASVSLAAWDHGHLLVNATQFSRYANDCNAQGVTPLPARAHPLSARIAFPRPGTRVVLATAGPRIERLRSGVAGGLITQASLIGSRALMSGYRPRGGRCFDPPTFTRVGSPAALTSGRPERLTARDLRTFVSYSDGSDQVGDFNGDGNQDILGTGFDASRGEAWLTIREGHSRLVDPGRPPSVTARIALLPGDESPPSVGFAGDLNSDGRDDITVLDNAGITILFGTSRRPTSSSRLACRTVETSSPASTTVGPSGDINGDGRPDLVLPRPFSQPAGARILLGPIEPHGHLLSASALQTATQRATASDHEPRIPICGH
jgi:hypothetical protein